MGLSSWCVRLGAARRTREACLRYQEEHGTGTPPAASSPTWWRLAPRPLPAQLPSEAHAQHQYWEAQQLAAYKQWHGMCNAPSWRWPRLGSASWWRIWHWAASTNPVGMACATPASMGSWHELGPTSRILRLFNTQVARVPTMAAVPGVSVLGCHGDAAAAAVCTGVRPSALVGRRRTVRSNACCRTRAGALICRLCTGKFAAVARCSAQGVEHAKRARVAAAPRQLRRGAWLRARRTHAALWRGRIGGGPIRATGEGPAAGASAAARPTAAATT